MDSPFIYGIAADSSHFIDRDAERSRLITNFTAGINTIIISPRRWGKTSLVNKVCEQLADNENLRIVKIDAFAVRTAEDFYRLFAIEVILQTSTRVEEWLANAKNYLATLTPQVSMSTDPVNPLTLSFASVPKKYGAEVLELPEHIAREKNLRIVICIDEFQQIGELSDSVTIQKQLRSVWQHQHLTSYCLYGSKRHLLTNMFGKYSMPFFKFGDLIYLERIPITCWTEFIQGQFSLADKSIDAEYIEGIYKYIDGNSSYMQQLSSLVYLRTAQQVTPEIIESAKNDLLNQCHALFMEQINNLSFYQINFLHAILQNKGSDINKKEIIDEYELGSSANVIALKRALQKKEMIEVSGKVITFADPLLPHWLRKNEHLFK